MSANRKVAFALTVMILTAGCVSAPMAPTPLAVPNAVRNEIGQLAVRAPSEPRISLTDRVDNRGKAAGKTAKSAGVGWLGASLEAAGQSENGVGAIFLAAFGIATAPLVAAGGAVYGAASADSQQSIDASNRLLADAFGFAPGSFQSALESVFSEAPVPITFVNSTASNQDLVSQGFDSVLDVRMNSIATIASDNQFEVSLESRNTLTLSRLADGHQMTRRDYDTKTDARKLSYWTDNQAQALSTVLAADFVELSADIAGEFFHTPSVGVQGLEPVSRGMRRYGAITGTMPIFIWRSWDGDQPASAQVEYELQVFAKGEEPTHSLKSTTTRYVPLEPLAACTKYRWRVRAQYQQFNQAAVSDWSRDYRFKTPCP
jgi:hypothetical protein